MKIVFVAVFTPNSTNVAQSRGFKDIGCDVLEYDYRSKLAEFNDVYTRDSDLINSVLKFKPDLVIFSKCNNMSHRVVDECNKISKTALWYMDAMNNFDFELIEKIKRCDYFICGVEGVIPHAEKFNKNCMFLQQCPDDLMNFLDHKLENTWVDDVTFIGSSDSSKIHADRYDYINFLKNTFAGFKHYNGVYGLEHNKIVNQSKINLNFSPTDSSGVSVRIFKILASGGFLMTTPWKDMENTFIPEKDVVVFSSKEELKDKIEFYLKNQDLRDKIRLSGYNKVQNYLPKNWAKNIVEYVTKREIRSDNYHSVL